MKHLDRIVIFDFDGTLADTFPAALKILQEFVDEGYLRPFSPEDIERWRHSNPKEVIKEIKLPWYFIPIMIIRGRNKIKQHIDWIELFAGIKESVTQITDTYRCVIISTNSAGFINEVLKNHDVQGFEEIIGGGFLSKQNKINKILRKYKIPQTHAVLITDETRDIESAQKSGIKSIAVTWGFQKRKSLSEQNPDLLVDSPDELIKAIETVFKEVKLVSERILPKNQN
jgi:phosphoglycolate phosphatase